MEGKGLWVVLGDLLDGAEDGNAECYLTVYRSREEAEAHACLPSDRWVWDRRPAKKTTLLLKMREARANGYAGVLLIGYVDSERTELRTWPVDEPLLGSDDA